DCLRRIIRFWDNSLRPSFFGSAHGRLLAREATPALRGSSGEAAGAGVAGDRPAQDVLPQVPHADAPRPLPLAGAVGLADGRHLRRVLGLLARRLSDHAAGVRRRSAAALPLPALRPAELWAVGRWAGG